MLPRLAALHLVIALASACGSDPVEPDPALADQLAQLETLPAPEGVETATWDALKTGLAAAIRQRMAEGIRAASATTTVDSSRAQLAFDETTGELSWGYAFTGDYDQNGEVNISDLTPLGVHFGKSVPAGEPDHVLAVIDGDGNGLLTIADLSPIGRSIGARVTGYNIYTSAAATDAPTENDAASTIEPLDSIALSEAVGVPAQGRRRFTYTVDSPVALAYYWVRPTDGTEEGTRSSLAGGPPNDLPEASLAACPFNGAAPFDAVLSAEASDDDGEIVAYRWDFDGNGTFDQVTGNTEPVALYTYDTEGTFVVVLEVVDDRGATARASATVVVGPNRWNTQLVTEPAHGYGEAALLAQGDRPVIFSSVYSGGLGTDILRGAGPQGAPWQRTDVLDAPPDGPSVIQQFLLADGHPAFFAIGPAADNSPLLFYRAADAEGTTWPAPVRVLEDDTGTPDVVEFRAASGAAIVGGMPAVVVTRGTKVDPGVDPSELEFRLHYLSATAADGSGWGVPQEVTGAHVGTTYNAGNSNRLAVGGQLIEADGRPAVLSVVFDVIYLPDPGNSRFIPATAADGSAWAAPAFDLQGNGTLFTVDGKPAFGFSDRLASGTEQHKQNKLTLAADAAGSSWLPVQEVPHTSFARGGSRWAEVGGRPALATVRFGTLYFYSAADAQASQWLAPDPVVCLPTTYFVQGLADIAGQPALIYNDAFLEPGHIRYARRQE